MKKLFFPSICSLLLIISAMISCTKDGSSDKKSDPQILISKSESALSTKNGMLLFNSFKELNKKANELNASNDEVLKKFESSMGIKTPAGMFRAVLFSEDSLSNYYFNLPVKEQDYWKKQPQKHSEKYDMALSQGLIKIIKEKDGSEYFDLNLSQNSFATVLNAEGFVQVDTMIFQFTPTAIKMIKNGDFNLVDKLKSINTDYEDSWIIVEKMKSDTRLKYGMINSWTVGNLESNWIITDRNIFNTPIKRIRAWIDGHSEPYGSYSESCAQYIRGTYVLRAEAMKKNFWGTWIYGDYNPSYSVSSTWSYRYENYTCDPYITFGCGIYYCEHVNDSGMDSPYSNSWPSVNNLYVNLIPTGIWSGTYWFHSAFWSQGYFSGNFAGNTFYYTW
ncbi:MAG: hypothetical protein WC865_11565 [Bacteroidales bacterium]